MSARAAPYPPPGSLVRIPDTVWHAALHELRCYGNLCTRDGAKGSEGLVYFGGVTTPGELIVTSVLRIRHSPQGDRVTPAQNQVRWLLTTLRARDEKLLAQIHSHRYGTCHSRGDDCMATSFHEGFVSIVVPNFAHEVVRPEQCGFHEYRQGVFQRLSESEVSERIEILPHVLDRTPETGGYIRYEGPPIWKLFVRKLKSIGRRKQ